MNKKSLLTILICILCTFAVQPVNASFLVKKAVATQSIVASTTDKTNVDDKLSTLPERKVPRFLSSVASHFQKPVAQHAGKPGWAGIVAFCCSLGAILFSTIGLFFPLSIAAIVFGIIGLGHRYKNKGLALAGLILGGLELIVGLVIVAILAVALAIF